MRTHLKIKIKILVLRFSSLGDVVMTIPVIKDLIKQNKKIEIVFVSQNIYSSLFEEIKKLKFYGINLKEYKNFFSIYSLFLNLKINNFDYIIDLHNVLRTRLLTFFFKITFKKVYTLNKGKREKKKLICKNNKNIKQLTSMHERYAEVFRKAGFNLKLNNIPIEIPKSIKYIGVAPFAKYDEKIYPLFKMKNIIYELAKNNKKIILFGKGKDEEKQLKIWEKLHSNIISIAGKFSLKKELKYIKYIDVLISMDSSNMHLASLVRTPCISIWGATHRYSGFLGFNQKAENCIENNKILCRPCSVFGNRKCYIKNKKHCMHSISEFEILKKIL